MSHAARPNSASPIRRSRLSGPTPSLDPRIHAHRPDLADLALADRVAAANYAQAVAHVCRLAHVSLRAAPEAQSTAVSELLFGESFAVLEINADWAWGYCEHDHYVGYVAASALRPQGSDVPTHHVSSPAALLFTEADIKSPLLATLPLGARVAVSSSDGKFHALTGGGFVHERHLAPIGHHAIAPLDVARAFIGTPYLWGGRTRSGIDCSGLVQTALLACGIPCPRDSDQQRDTVGRAADPATLQAGDLVFFPGHVGIMADEAQLLHANAYWMSTVIEPLADVVDRLKPSHAEPILAVRRLGD